MNQVQKIESAHIQLDTLNPISKSNMIKLQKFQKQLSAKPNEKHVVFEQIGNEKFQHIPISIVEHLLKKIFFGLYKIEIIEIKTIVNELVVHVRLHVFHPIVGEWFFYDGVGAIPMLQDKDTKVAQFMEAKKRKAVQLNLPAAYSFAVKNAAKKIGKVFGGDLNRKYEDTYHGYNITDESETLNQ